jgi:hypothetical protein
MFQSPRQSFDLFDHGLNELCGGFVGALSKTGKKENGVLRILGICLAGAVRERTVSKGRFFSMATLSIPLFDGSHSPNVGRKS